MYRGHYCCTSLLGTRNCESEVVYALGNRGVSFCKMANYFIEYLKYGAGRPPGTMWAMEKSYFEWNHKYPNKTEYAYLRLALQYCYPLNKKIPEIAARCSSLDDAIMEAVQIDFGDFVAQMFKPALEAFPHCSMCG